MPGGNRLARDNPEDWSRTHTYCPGCGRTYCDRCTAGLGPSRRCHECGDTVTDPDTDRRTRLTPAMAAHHRGLRMFQDGRWEQALAAFDEAVGLPGAPAGSHFTRGLLLFRLGRHDEALSSFTTTARIDPGHADAHHYTGVIHLRGGRATLAATAFDRALGHDPAHLYAAAMRMEALTRAGRPRDCVRIGERTLAAAKNPDFTALASVYALLGDALQHLHRDEEALAMLDIASGIGEDDPAVHRVRAAVLRRLHRDEEAALAARLAAAIGDRP
ncbi:tetratricopeptide repeat protein [Winogradskya consettensis]|uniref:tetratricopeptide repeat protein n=1 Tax=Winogradskya consettensis TaxID=113560 RepID=UPI001BB3F7EC|nr:tetratricopeptide repeat protein [Actinoplanes consettensis]